MAAKAGRDVVLSKNATALAGMRQIGMTVAVEGIDITDGDDKGVRTFLAGASGSESIDLTFEGVVKDSLLRDIMMGGPSVDKLLTDLSMDFDDGKTLTGDFLFNNFSQTGEHKGEATFTASFQSSGDWTYT